MTDFISKKAPPDGINIPLAHKITELYQTIYQIGRRIPKRDRFGIHAKTEILCFEALELVICAAFAASSNKQQFLEKLRIKIEVLKRFIRNEYELAIINEKNYFAVAYNLQEISKMTNGWIKYIQNERGQ